MPGMVRVFAGLASGLLLTLCGAAVLGFMVVGDRLFVQHFALGLFAALLTALVHVVTFTYFTVTGKAIHQAVALARLEEAAMEETQRIKRGATGCIVIAFLPLVATVALGAHTWGQREHSTYHLIAALTCIIANALALMYEFRLIRQNDAIMQVIMSEYRSKGPSPASDVVQS